MGSALTHSPAAPTTASPGRAEQTRRAGRGSGSGGGRRQRNAAAGTGSRLPPRRLLHRHHLAPPEEEPRRQEGGPSATSGRGGRRPGSASAATCEERARRRGCPGLRRELPTGKGPGLRPSVPLSAPGHAEVGTAARRGGGVPGWSLTVRWRTAGHRAE